VVKAGKLYRLELASSDVVHAFYIPELGIKYDAVPGFVYVIVDTPGTYHILCGVLRLRPLPDARQSGGAMIREKLGYLTTTESHKIGILYIVLAVINLMLAGVMAFIIRLTIATTPPATNVGSVGLITGDVYCWVMSLHGLATLLLFAMQAVTGLANVAVPKLIGAPDLYWPRINALSFWLQILDTVLM
jgi:hypothetical protein